MFTAILSDFHLNPQKIDSATLTWFKKIYSHPQISRVIINGDFIEMYSFNWGPHHFDTFVKTWFPHLIPILSQKPTIIISGNHDPHSWYDHRIKKLSQQFLKQYVIPINGQKFQILHGHQFTLKGMPTTKLQYLLFDLPSLIIYRLFPKLINLTFGRYFNQKVFVQIPSKTNLIIGHTHAFALFPQHRFYNSGANCCHQQQGLLLDVTTGNIKDIHTLL